MQIKQLLSLGNLTIKAHVLDRESRKIRNQIRESCLSGFWTSTSLDENLEQLTLSVKMPIYLQFAPEDVQPRCVTFQAGEGREQAYARLRYPPIEVGLCGAKKATRLFIDAWSEPFEPPKQPEQPQPQTEPVIAP